MHSERPRTDWWSPVAWMGVGKVGKIGQKAHTSSYKISKFWGYHVQHGDYS